MFNKNSGLVRVWVGLIGLGIYKAEHVPNLSNLKEVVSEVVKEMTGDIVEVEKEEKPAAPTAEEQPADEPADLMATAQ